RHYRHVWRAEEIAAKRTVQINAETMLDIERLGNADGELAKRILRNVERLSPEGQQTAKNPARQQPLRQQIGHALAVEHGDGLAARIKRVLYGSKRIGGVANHQPLTRTDE